MNTKYNVVDLFSGAGGLSLGAARAGFAVCGAVETDPHAIKTHMQNFPFTTHIPVDISELTGKGLYNFLDMKEGSLTGIVGGPPCQGFSVMGKRDIGDPRNRLFSDFFRIVSECKPKFFLAENVPGIMRKDNGNILEDAFSYVDDEYEYLPPIKVNASEYGAPTTRTRLFFVGYQRDRIENLLESDFNPPSDIQKVFVKDALQGLPKKINPEWQSESQGWRPVSYSGKGYYNLRLKGHIPSGMGDPAALKRLKKEKMVSGCLGTVHSEKIIERYANTLTGERDPVSKTVRLDPNGFCPTLRAGTDSNHGSYQAVRPIHPTEDRVITPREAARLQGFPDWFQFSPTKWHSFRQIGNSVSPIVAERMMNVIKEALI